MGLVLVSVALIPVCVLVSGARDSSLGRRSNFRVRFVWFIIGVSLPELLIGLGSAAGIVHGASLLVLLLALFWGLALLPLAPLLLFHGPGFDPGQSDEGGPGPDSGDEPPSPTSPHGGLPLPDAKQSALRLRGPGRTRVVLRRSRRACDPARAPTEVPPVRGETLAPVPPTTSGN